MMGYHPPALLEVTEKTSIPAVEDRVKTCSMPEKKH